MQKDKLALICALALSVSSTTIVGGTILPTLSQAKEIEEIKSKLITKEDIVSSMPIEVLTREVARLEAEALQLREEEERLALEEQLRLEEIERVRLEEEARISSNKQDWIFEVSYYCACYYCTQNGNGQTASGAYAVQGVTIACPSDIPFGSEVYIEGVGTFINQDRGGFIQHVGSGVMRVDVYLDSHEEALSRGRYNRTGHIIINK